VTEILAVPSDPTPVPVPVPVAARDPRAGLWAPVLVLGIPAAWAVTLLFHPTGEEWYPTVHGQLATWQAVHLAMIAFIPLMALAIHRLVAGIDNPAARVCRVALPVFAVTYGVFEATLGIGMGLLVAGVDDLPSDERATGTTLVDAYADSPVLAVIELVAAVSCGVVIVAAAFALHRSGRIGGPMVVAFVVAAPLVAIHAPPFGPVGLALFVVAATTALRHRVPGGGR
jgi:hypothetical protein